MVLPLLDHHILFLSSITRPLDKALSHTSSVTIMKESTRDTVGSVEREKTTSGLHDIQNVHWHLVCLTVERLSKRSMAEGKENPTLAVQRLE